MAKPLIVNKDNVIIPAGTMEDFKRPSHPDFKTSSELAKDKFNGLRVNSLTNSMELWIEGEIVKTVTQEMLALNPNAVTDACAEFFQLDQEVRPDIPALRKYRGEEKK